MKNYAIDKYELWKAWYSYSRQDIPKVPTTEFDAFKRAFAIGWMVGKGIPLEFKDEHGHWENSVVEFV